MNAPHSATSLLHDALAQLLICPSASQRWQRLFRHCFAGAPQAEVVQVCKVILSQIPAEGAAGILRATFLAAVTGDRAFSGQAMQLALARQPLDADCIAALSGFEWGRALGLGGGRDEFIQQLRLARLPDACRFLGDYLASQIPLRPRPIKGLTKVALVAPFLGGPEHPPTRLAFQQAQLLQAEGQNVQIFCAQEAILPDMAMFFGNDVCYSLQSPPLAALQQQLPPGVSLRLADTAFSLLRRWLDLSVAIADFDPDWVLFVGFNSPWLGGLYAARPVVGLCVQSCAPMAAVDVWLTARTAEADQLNQDWAPALPDAWGHWHPFRVPRPWVQPGLHRQFWELPEGRLVLVTVGARLASEITGSWAAAMVALCLANPQLVWVLVGGEGRRPQALMQLPDEQLRVLPQQDALAGLLACCDIYVNPERLGGGFSVAEAMALGLPVVSLANGDAGDKLSAWAAKDLADYFTLLTQLLANPRLRAERGQAMQDAFAEHLDLAKAGPSLIVAAQQAQRLWRERVII